MINRSRLLGCLFVLGCLYSFASCKPTEKSSVSAPKVEENTTVSTTTEKDTSSPLDNLGNLGSIGGNTETVAEQESGMNAKLPVDETFRMGVLDNGMHYYIRKNAKPENRIELRLAVDAGAMQEEDDQRGLAHFVEHMAFNGTRNFEKNDLVDFLESTGVRFGADLNAYTSFDETVYMLQLPTDKEGLVEKGLLVMSDWATGVTFEDEEIDKERGVIESEWRTRLGADERMRHTYWPKLFYESRYAQRLPIGTMEVIRNAPYERLRTFYKDWYRPNLMAIVVVGDLDVDDIEKQIKEKFSILENPENPREKKLYDVPNHKETFVAIATDEEATNTSVDLLFKHAPEETTTLDDYRRSLVHRLYNTMLNERFGEMTQKADAPFLNASSGYVAYVRNKNFYALSTSPKSGEMENSLKAVLTESQRVLQHGFTDSELERQKLAILKRYEKSVKEQDKLTSGSLSMGAVYHFLQDRPLLTPAKKLELVKEFLPTIKLEEINKLANEWMTEENLVVLVTAPEKEKENLLDKEAILKLIQERDQIKTEPYKDKFLDLPLLEKAPTAGKVVKENLVTTDSLGLTEWTLSNGVRVVLKPTTFKNDEILISGYSPGGHSIYDDKDFFSAANAAAIVDKSGVGAFDLIALEKKLTGKTLAIYPYISELYEGFKGYSSNEDFEDMLKVMYLYATKPRKDKDAFDTYISEYKEQMKNVLANPQQYFINEYIKTMNQENIRRSNILSDEDINKINLDRAFEIYQDRFSDFSDFTFTIVGSFEPSEIKPLVELYLGSLPSKNRKENWKDIGVRAPAEATSKNMKKGLAPQSFVIVSSVLEKDWSMEKAVDVEAMIGVLKIMVRENLREDKGGVYSPYVGGGFTNTPIDQASTLVFFQCAPDDVEVLVDAVKEEFKSLQEQGPSDDNMQKVKETARRGRETSLKENNFWMGVLTSYMQQDRPLTDIKKYEALIDELSKEDVQKAAKEYIDLEKLLIITLKPEKETEERP